MESKKLKLKVHHRNFSGESKTSRAPTTELHTLFETTLAVLSARGPCSGEDLIVNPQTREKLGTREGDLLEIFPPDDHHGTWR